MLVAQYMLNCIYPKHSFVLKNTGIKSGFPSAGLGYRCVLRRFFAKLALDAINQTL
jgi:hypothetical protein